MFDTNSTNHGLTRFTFCSKSGSSQATYIITFKAFSNVCVLVKEEFVFFLPEGDAKEN